MTEPTDKDIDLHPSEYAETGRKKPKELKFPCYDGHPQYKTAREGWSAFLALMIPIFVITVIIFARRHDWFEGWF